MTPTKWTSCEVEGSLSVPHCPCRKEFQFNFCRLKANPYALRLRSLSFRLFPSPCLSCALTIALISPGNLFSISRHRDVIRISTPTRSPRISPASRSALKCCDKVDLGILFSLTFKKLEQICGHPAPTISAKIATRTGSDKA
jgi:hypothetical protein